MKKFGIVVLPFCLLASATVFAQSKIDCVVDDAGTAHAPLIWQNTLGVARANAICQAQSVKREEIRHSRERVNKPDQPDQVATTRFSNDTKERASSFVEGAQSVKDSESFDAEFSRAW